jgi:5-methylcytosine-specific restriction endonuclease McrA
MEIITRKQAKEQGLTHYFTGEPCKHGHVAKRLTSKGICTDCNRTHNKNLREAGYNRSYYATRMANDPAFRETKREDSRRHYHNVMKHDEGRMRRRYEQIAEYQKGNRETCNRAKRAFNERNPGYDRTYTAAYRARQAKAIAQLTTKDRQQIKAIYELRARLSKETGTLFHVDHRIPISRGGLHHPSNLWVITAEENLRKHAKLPEELAA